MGGRDYVPIALRGIINPLPPSSGLIGATNFEELEQWGKEKFGEKFYIDDYIKRNGDLEKVKGFLVGAESTYNDYPETKVTRLTMDYGGDSYIAYASWTGQLNLNSKWFGKRAKQRLKGHYGEGWFHPNVSDQNDNATYLQQVGAHEMQHLADFSLDNLMRRNNIGKPIGNERATRANTIAINKAIEIEVKEARKEGIESGKTSKGYLISHKISEYASKNNMETLAEARADVFSNGEKASRLSKNIINEFTKIYKQTMDKIK